VTTPEQRDDEPTSEVDGERRYAVVTDRPVEVLNPRGTFLRLNIGWAVALLIVAFLAAYGATYVASYQSEKRVATLLAELDRRTAERKANEKKSARVLEQNRRTLCSIMKDHEKNDELRKLLVTYHCGTAKDPVVPPGWTPPPGWPALPGTEGASPARPARVHTETPRPVRADRSENAMSALALAGDVLNQWGVVVLAAGDTLAPSNAADPNLNLTLWSSITGVVAPFLVALVNQPHWAPLVRALMTVLVSTGLGGAAAAIEGQLTGVRWTTAALIVGAAAVSSYETLWRKPARALELASTIGRHRADRA
jgi:hypothetical protein